MANQSLPLTLATQSLPTDNPLYQSLPSVITNAFQAIANDAAQAAAVSINQSLPKTINKSVEEIFTAALPDRSKAFAPFLLKYGTLPYISPIMLWAIMEIESASNPEAIGYYEGRPVSFGLMQINKSAHPDLIDFDPTTDLTWQDPETNIGWGALILSQYFKNLANSGKPFSITIDGTKYKIGGPVDAGNLTDVRPLSGLSLVSAGIASYNQGPGAILYSLAIGDPADTRTEHGNYSAKVQSKMSVLVDTMSGAGVPGLDVTSLATYAVSASNGAEFARIYRGAYDTMKSYSRTQQMVQTTRAAHYAVRAANAVRRNARICGTLAATSQAAQTCSVTVPAITPDTLRPLMYDFTTGLWSDGKTV